MYRRRRQQEGAGATEPAEASLNRKREKQPRPFFLRFLQKASKYEVAAAALPTLILKL